MKLCAIIFAIIGTAIGNPLIEKEKAAAATPCYSNAFDGYSQTGYYYTFKAYVSNLHDINFNDAICSVEQTGMWIYYENSEYNTLLGGDVYWVHGVGISVNFPPDTCGTTTSLKYGGNRQELNEDSYTLYSGENFTSVEFYGNIESPELDEVSGETSSLILTGLSPWTLYTGLGYTGAAYCFYPSTDEDVGLDGTILNFGFYESFTSIGAPDNLFYSVQKGCHARTIFRGPQMQAQQRFRHGAWGILSFKNAEQQH